MAGGGKSHCRTTEKKEPLSQQDLHNHCEAASSGWAAVPPALPYMVVCCPIPVNFEAGGGLGDVCAEKEFVPMSTTTSTRFKTGQTCPTSGDYRFDGYTDGTSSPSPTAEEREISLSRDETFPPIKSSGKACWWVLVRRA